MVPAFFHSHFLNGMEILHLGTEFLQLLLHCVQTDHILNRRFIPGGHYVQKMLLIKDFRQFCLFFSVFFTSS